MKKILSRISSLELKEDEMLVVKGGATGESTGGVGCGKGCHNSFGVLCGGGCRLS